VELTLDPKAPGLSFGIIGESSTQSWWKMFSPRFGKVAWRTMVAIDDMTSGKGDAVLKTLLWKEPVNVVLMETGRLRRGSPVWEDEGVMVVLSLDGWRRSTPSQWTTQRMKIRHDQFGGVTEGEFTVLVAHTGEFTGFDWCENLQGVPARLGQVLECTGTGKKVPIPNERPEGWTQDGRLHWERRYDKIMTPTVFDKTSWVVRQLGLKELKSVMDVPAMMDCGTELRAKLKEMKMPGKIYVCLLDEVRRAFEKRRQKRSRRETDTRMEMSTVILKSWEDQEMKKTSASVETDGEYQNEQERRPTNSDKVVKADDALAPVFLWNAEVCRPIDRLNPEDPAVIAALDVLRVKLLLPDWKTNVVLSLTDWLRENEGRMMAEEFEKCKESGKQSLILRRKSRLVEMERRLLPILLEVARRIPDGYS
jgi:hypothetical protein